MKLEEVSKYLVSLLERTDKKSEIKFYNKFLATIDDLKSRNFSEPELHSIEEELKNLQLDADTNNRKKYLRKKLNKFSTFLKDKFSLIPEGHYSQMGLALGMTFGVALGLSIGNSLEIDNGMTYGLVFGMIFGLAFGKQKDSKAEKQNLVMKTNKKKQ